jgi:outer membrane protein
VLPQNNESRRVRQRPVNCLFDAEDFYVLKYTVICISALLVGASLGSAAEGAPASPAAKVGIINIAQAIVSTKDGQKAAADFNAKFQPVKQRLATKQAEIKADQAKLNQGNNALSAEQRDNLMRQIDQKTKSLNRESEDANAEQEQEQGRIMQDLGKRIMVVIDKYSKDHGYSLVLDVGSQQTPVLFATDNITAEFSQRIRQENSLAGATVGVEA